jgi:hypothetical protein
VSAKGGHHSERATGGISKGRPACSTTQSIITKLRDDALAFCLFLFLLCHHQVSTEMSSWSIVVWCPLRVWALSARSHSHARSLFSSRRVPVQGEAQRGCIYPAHGCERVREGARRVARGRWDVRQARVQIKQPGASWASLRGPRPGCSVVWQFVHDRSESRQGRRPLTAGCLGFAVRCTLDPTHAHPHPPIPQREKHSRPTVPHPFCEGLEAIGLSVASVSSF